MQQYSLNLALCDVRLNIPITPPADITAVHVNVEKDMGDTSKVEFTNPSYALMRETSAQVM